MARSKAGEGGGFLDDAQMMDICTIGIYTAVFTLSYGYLRGVLSEEQKDLLGWYTLFLPSVPTGPTVGEITAAAADAATTAAELGEASYEVREELREAAENAVSEYTDLGSDPEAAVGKTNAYLVNRLNELRKIRDKVYALEKKTPIPAKYAIRLERKKLEIEIKALKKLVKE